MADRQRVFWVPSGDYDPAAPTIADLGGGIKLTDLVAEHGIRTDDGDGIWVPRDAMRTRLYDSGLDGMVADMIGGIATAVPAPVFRPGPHDGHDVINGEVVDVTDHVERRAIEGGERSA